MRFSLATAVSTLALATSLVSAADVSNDRSPSTVTVSSGGPSSTRIEGTYHPSHTLSSINPDIPASEYYKSKVHKETEPSKVADPATRRPAPRTMWSWYPGFNRTRNLQNLETLSTRNTKIMEARAMARMDDQQDE